MRQSPMHCWSPYGLSGGVVFKRQFYFLVFALLVVLPTCAPAQGAKSPPRDMGKEQQIWQELKAIAPGMVETFKAATVAMDKGDYPQAVKLYGEVYKKAPNYDVVMRRLGTSMFSDG